MKHFHPLRFALVLLLVTCSLYAGYSTNAPVTVPSHMNYVDGRSLQGAYIDLADNDRLYWRFATMSDTGVEVERVTNGVVVWRIRSNSLGVEHSKYNHRAQIHFLEGEPNRFLIHSVGSYADFYEIRDLNSGRLIQRRESSPDQQHFATPPTHVEVDGVFRFGGYIDISLGKGERVYYRYAKNSDRGVDLEFVANGKSVWRVRAVELGAVQAKQDQVLLVEVYLDKLLIRSTGPSANYREWRDLQSGELIEREFW